MSKIAQRRQDYLSRSGNFSTVPSATGANLLGYGAQERLSPMQQREALIAALEALKTKRKTLLPGSPAYRKCGMEIHDLNAEIKAINEQTGDRANRQDVGHFLVNIFKSRVTKAEWKIIVADARRMCDEQDAPAPEQSGEPTPLYLALGIVPRSYAEHR